MKIINLQDYQKDKIIENFKGIIKDSSIDENLKDIINGLLDIDLINFKNFVETYNTLHSVINSSNEITNTLKQQSDSLNKDIPKFMTSTNELLKRLQEDIIVLSARIKELEQKINK
jgi:gas vesicle protein